MPCTTGCHIAFFSDALPACYDECDVANDGSLNSCSYTVSCSFWWSVILSYLGGDCCIY